jgi:hypothetical protein
VKLNDSRISDPEIPKSQVGRRRAEKSGSTFSRIIAYAPVQFKVSGFPDLRSWNCSILQFPLAKLTHEEASVYHRKEAHETRGRHVISRR